MVVSCSTSLNIHFLNCCSALLIETGQGLALVDTRQGQEDFLRRSGMLRAAHLVTIAAACLVTGPNEMAAFAANGTPA